MTEVKHEIDTVVVAIRRTETRVAMKRNKLIHIHSNVTLPSLKRVCKLVPLDARQKLSLGMGWAWRRQTKGE